MDMKHNNRLTQHYASVRLTAEERADMQSAILAHMHAPKGAIRSPFYALISPYTTRPVAALLVVAILGISTSGITYASQSALPDEALYSVKRLSERVETLLARTSHSQVETAGRHALKRIQEATQMHIEGRMTSDHEIALSDSVREELLRVSHVVAIQEDDTPTARESAVVLAKVVGYTNVLNQASAEESIEIGPSAQALTGVSDALSGGRVSPLVEQIEFFVDSHEDAIAEAVSNDANIVAENFIGEIGATLLKQTPDPLVEATITAVIVSENALDMFPEEKGSRVLHALADMAEGTATVEVMNTQSASHSHLQNI